MLLFASSMDNDTAPNESVKACEYFMNSMTEVKPIQAAEHKNRHWLLSSF